MNTYHTNTCVYQLSAFDDRNDHTNVRNQSIYEHSIPTSSSPRGDEVTRYTSQSPGALTADLESAVINQVSDPVPGCLRRFNTVLWNPPQEWRDYWKKYRFIQHAVFRLVEIEVACLVLNRIVVRDRVSQALKGQTMLNASRVS